MHRLLILLAACDMGVTEKPELPGPIYGIAGHHYAVVHLESWRDECSNMGGMHYTLSVDGLPTNRLLHAGGHGVNIWRRELGRRQNVLPRAIEGEDSPLARYFVAEIDLADHPLPPIRDPGWCLDGMPVYYGSADRLVPATDLADARARLAAIPHVGYPPGEISLHE